MALPSSPKKVVVLALPGARELDLASVLDVFTQANWQLAPNSAYQVEVVTSDAKGRVTGMTGLQLVGNGPYFACTGEIDTLLIAGGVSLVTSDPEEPSLVAWLRNRAFECRRGIDLHGCFRPSSRGPSRWETGYDSLGIREGTGHPFSQDQCRFRSYLDLRR